MKTLTKYSLVKQKSEFTGCKITSSFDAYDCLKSIWEDGLDVYESFYLLVLNRSNVSEGYVRISAGGVAGTVVDVKIIANYAVQALASGVIVAHNHPSGNLKPSQADITITENIKKALSHLDIKLLDHIILGGDGGYYSFGDEGTL